MPHIPQDYLTPLYTKAQLVLVPSFQPPTYSGLEIVSQWLWLEKTMDYLLDDTWEFTTTAQVQDVDGWFGWYYWSETTLTITIRIQLFWDDNRIQINTTCRPAHEAYWTQNDFSETITGVERGKPWFLDWTNLTYRVGRESCRVTSWRPVPGTLISKIPAPFTPASTLKCWSGSFLARGPIDGKTITYKPTYPPNAIQGVTPATGRGAILRKHAQPKIYTDPGHVAANDAFASAAQQWNALDQTARANWTAAGKTCKPPIPGYALWTQILTTKRLDRIPTLETRTGLSLTPPTL